MIISPARFEDVANKIISSNDERLEKLLDLNDLIIDTLDSLGYGAGIKVITDWTKE